MTQLKPQLVLNKMVDDFVKAGEGLFTSPPPTSVSREKGTYVYLYAKLSKRLSSTLAVDREVLILFTSFEEQQQRTIKTASDLIAASSGRLENSLVIIIHADAEGNAKLKRWGRKRRALRPSGLRRLVPKQARRGRASPRPRAFQS